MATEHTRYTYSPDYVVHPGEVLEETLEAYGMSQTELARRTGISTKTLSQVVNGKAPVTPDTAIQLERVLGVSAATWTNLNANYSLAMARQTMRQNLEDYGEWIEGFPYSDLVGLGFAEPASSIAERAAHLLDFFGVADKEGWSRQYGSLQPQTAFRRSHAFSTSLYAVATWLRIAELRAQEADSEPFDAGRFAHALLSIRGMTREPADVFAPAMQVKCAESGVALVFVGELKGTHVSGAARWLSPSKALVALSLRHKTDDHFWFSFFHEAGHILRDSKKKVFVDGLEAYMCDEEKADRFACNIMIPEEHYVRFTDEGALTERAVLAFADEEGIAPGIVVGRLQHDKHLPFNSRLNHLKRKFELSRN